MLMDAKDFTFTVRTDLVDGGRNVEDGSPVIVEMHYVVAEDVTGARWAHEFLSPHHDEVVGFYDKLIECAKADAQINSRSWSPIQAAYGSKAYLEEEPHIVAQERDEDRRNLLRW